MDKKRILLIFIVLVFIIVGVVLVFANYNTKKLPNLKINYNGREIKTMRGSYLWKRGFKNEVYIVDSYAKVINQLSPGEKVTQNGELQLNFDYQPKKIILSSTYDNEKKILENNFIQLPTNINGPIIYFWIAIGMKVLLRML